MVDICEPVCGLAIQPTWFGSVSILLQCNTDEMFALWPIGLIHFVPLSGDGVLSVPPNHSVEQAVDACTCERSPSVTKVLGLRRIYLLFKCSNATLKRHDVLSQLRDVLM